MTLWLLGVVLPVNWFVLPINDGQIFACSYFKKENTKYEVLLLSLRFGGHQVLVIQLCIPRLYAAACTHPPLPTARRHVLHLQCGSFSCQGLEAFHQNLSPQNSMLSHSFTSKLCYLPGGPIVPTLVSTWPAAPISTPLLLHTWVQNSLSTGWHKRPVFVSQP